MIKSLLLYVKAIWKEIKLFIKRLKDKKEPFILEMTGEPGLSSSTKHKIIEWRNKERKTIDQDEQDYIKDSQEYLGEVYLKLANGINWDVNKELLYRKDIVNWDRRDYWQPSWATEYLRTGDCEDYAILKYRIMRECGFPDNRIGIILIKGHAFAALLEPENDDFFILDNGSISYFMKKASETLPYDDREIVCGFNLFNIWGYTK